MKNAGYQDEEFLDRTALDAELTRVFEKCHDCRRCLPLCPSFPSLFASIDRNDLEASRLTADERREVVDLCYECKLCYNHCPYHPPHEWEIDFPKLMTRAKLVQGREEGIPFSERMGMKQDLLGTCSCLAAPITNALWKNRAARVLMEKVTGIDRRWIMPTYERTPLSKALRGLPDDAATDAADAADARDTTPGAAGSVLLFSTCFVEYSDARTGRAARAVLLHNDVAVEPIYPGCCGAPFLHGGDLEGARRSARKVVAGLAPGVRAGKKVVVTGPTCSFQLKKEIPELLGTEDARLVAAATMDVFEFLWTLRGAGTLKKDFRRPLGRVAYHLPCHLKSQNIGFRSMQFLKGAGADVEMLDRCSGVDGTWGMKKRYYEESLKIAQPLLDAVKEAKPDRVATDCPLSALRILEGTGLKPVHPIELLAEAYGLDLADPSGPPIAATQPGGVDA